MLTSEVLHKAADTLQAQGWHQGGYAPAQESHGTPMDGLPVCALGAIYQAARVSAYWNADLECWYGFDRARDDDADRAGDAVADYLDLTDKYGSIPTWNDTKGRTASEVIEVLRATALIEAAKENAETRQAVSA